jgi:hypothetical protein
LPTADSFGLLSPGKVLHILQVLKLGKASDLDSISHQMLKKTCNNNINNYFEDMLFHKGPTIYLEGGGVMVFCFV